jgi:hypothetical protein
MIGSNHAGHRQRAPAQLINQLTKTKLITLPKINEPIMI